MREAGRAGGRVLPAAFGALGAAAGVLVLLRRAGLEAVLILAVTATAAFWGRVIRWLLRDGRITLSHIFAIWIVWTGTLMGGLSYYLAYRGAAANLETLSRYVMVEVVAGMGGYFLKSAAENVARSKGAGPRDL